MKDEGGRRKDPEPVTRHRSPVTAFIALGANVGNPAAQIGAALRAIAALPETRLAQQSSLYRNPPVGYLDQPEFVNGIAQIETGLAPDELLHRLLEIECRQGRVRAHPNAPRTLDLDVVLYGNRVIEEPGLVVPHPRMLERAFVMVPLAEIAPDAVVPGKGRVADLLRNVDASGMIRLENQEPPMNTDERR